MRDELVFATSAEEKRWFTGLGAVSFASRLTPGMAQRAVAGWILSRRQENGLLDWVSDELQRNSWTAVLSAGAALGRFDSRPWLAEIDVPTAVVLTRNDRVVAPRRQRAMAAGIRGAVVHEVDGDHAIVAMAPGRFVPALLDALKGVARGAPLPQAPLTSFAARATSTP